jgi:hypothetical protein
MLDVQCSASCSLLRFHRPIDRQFHRKPASFSDGASHCHSSPMRIHNVLHNAESNADSLRFPPQLRSDSIKSLEDALVFLGWNARAVVFDPEADA